MTDKIPSFKEDIDMIHVPTDKLNTIISNFSLDSETRKQQVKRKRNRILIAAACLLIGIPTTAFGAVKAYDMIVQKQNYEVNISVVNKIFNMKDSWYKMKIGYLPENMEANDSLAMKYSFKDNYENGGFSFILWRLGKNSDFQTLYANGYEEKEINGRKAVIVNKDTGNKNVMFDRQVFLLFEEEGMMVESYVGKDVSDEQLLKVIEGISLESTTEEKATYTADYDGSLFSEAKEPTESRVIPLKKDSKQLFKVGQTVPVTIEMNETESKLEYVIEKVEVFDSIKDFKQGNFNELGLEILSENKALDQTNKFLPYKRDVYKVGNGKDSVDELVESQVVNLKFVYLTTTLKNSGKQASEEIYMHPSLQVLKFEKNAWNYAGEDGIAEDSIMTGEVDYLEPHGNGKGFYNIGSIQPGQTMKVNLGYFVDADKLDSIFLDAFHYSGFGDTENMNSKDRWWIDIRQ
ncbi:anti-sigma factor [Neobacillus sp. 179-C4.2 HS]|uniref:Anti-sigma factor n=1 Tax=Neobacillus driksii TaxID=3035913 RepID=A0ABV4Z1Q0_9BACI|nr:anti-sigma factor [Neobacillus sp. 179.-C4.2 HS]MDP5195206.1 anti-sigma factor [Neobacillus sp. 179.-C4.2 HS]